MKTRKKIKHPRKPQFVVDHNTSYNDLHKLYGKSAKFVSSAKLTGSQATIDPEIIRIANQNNYHVITLNTRDFREVPIEDLTLDVGLICINLQEKTYKNIFGKLLRKKTHHRNFMHKVIILGNPVREYSYTELREKGLKAKALTVDL